MNNEVAVARGTVAFAAALVAELYAVTALIVHHAIAKSKILIICFLIGLCL
jgi:hypothetical protein